MVAAKSKAEVAAPNSDVEEEAATLFEEDSADITLEPGEDFSDEETVPESNMTLEDLLDKFTNEELLEKLAQRGIDQNAIFDLELRKQTEDQQARIVSPVRLIKDKSKLTQKQLESKKAVYKVRNKTVKSITEVNGDFYKAEKRNPNYNFEFSHFETTNFDWERGIA